MAILGLLVFGLGYSYCHLLLHLYGGDTLAEGTGPDLLRAQVFLTFSILCHFISHLSVSAHSVLGCERCD